MKPDGAGLMVVGDDAQAIYGFRAATVRNILEFPERFPGTTIVRLERNYRSGQPILDVSNAVIALSPQRHEKTLWTDRVDGAKPLLHTCLDDADQADAVCRSVLQRRESGTELKEQAVLFRAAHHSDVLEVELARRNIPFVKYGGLKFLECAHVKDALSVLRICGNPRDEVSWFRVLQLLDGVGPATARRLMTSLHVENGGGLRTLAEGDPFDVPLAAQRELDALREVMRTCAATDPPPPAVQLGHVRRWLEPILRRRSGPCEPRIRDLEQLEQLAGGFPTRDRFVTDLTLDPPSSTSDLAGAPLLDEDYLVLSTVHSAKGGEWDVVHVIHAADGMFPSDMATGDDEQIEEERRLFYVALTRARRHLEVSFPLRYHRRSGGREDRHWYAQLTRFLPPEVHVHFRTETTHVDHVADGTVVATPGTSEGVDAHLAGLFAPD